MLGFKILSHLLQCTEVCFASFLSSGFTTMEEINSLESKLAERISVQWALQKSLNWRFSKSCTTDGNRETHEIVTF